MDKIITIKEAAKLLGYKKPCSVERWCEKNGVTIWSGDGSNKRYVMSMQFEYARLKRFIGDLKAKHKGKWLDVFKVYMSMNIISVVEMEEVVKMDFVIEKNAYQPSGKHEKEFLTRLTKNNHEQ